MTTYDSNFFESNMPCVAPSMTGVLYVTEGTVELPATAADGDIARICYLPADCVPVDLVVHTEELDSNTTDTLTFSVGLLNSDGDAVISGTTLLAGGTADAVQTLRGAGAGFNGITRDKTNDRILAVEITADPATGAAGKMRVVLTFRVSQWGS